MASDSTRITFGPFSFDSNRCALSRGAVTIPLQHQPAKVLAYLLSQRHRLVTRTELMQHVWPAGHHVDFDRGLNYCVRRIRIALSDSAGSPRYFETLPRKGYRWIAPVTTSTTAEPLLERNGVATVWHRPVPMWRAFAATVACAVLTASLVIRLGPRPVATSNHSAVTVAETSTETSEDRFIRLKVALNALHRLSHALVDPSRRWELPMAIETLRTVSLGHNPASAAR